MTLGSRRSSTVELEKEDDEAPLLFESKEGKWGGAYKLFACTIFAGICMILVYRVMKMPKRGEEGRWGWIAMLWAEVCFGVYWIFTQSLRWTLLYHIPFDHRLFQRYGENKLPGVDIFVCTADPMLEPPNMVINTVLSVMCYNYPSNKLSVYLSDDGASELTFYALLKASIFSKHWIPFCKRFNIEPRSPEAYFSQHYCTIKNTQEWSSIKKLYEDMKSEIELVVEKGKVPDEIRKQHKGFSEWNSKTTKKDHQSIVQIIIDGRDSNGVDDDGFQLPTLVYMAREKRPNFPHHFKAGAMNALIRVSSEISNAPIILNLDCDMYSNNADTIQEVLCFFMDQRQGHQLAYVQFPQHFNNINKNDLYANSFPVSYQIEFPGMVGEGGATMFIGTGCFHRRESLSGMHFKHYNNTPKCDINPNININTQDQDHHKMMRRSVEALIEASKGVSSCGYEEGSEWGKEKGLVYGIPVEDVVTGLRISCRGWKSIYYNPKRAAFVGVAPTTLEVTLIQHKRWGEGLFLIFFSKFCPFICGYRKISLGVQMGYCAFLLWAPLSLPTIAYAVIPAIYTLWGIPLFPPVTSRWMLPFLYAPLATHVYSLLEAMRCGCSIKSWWNSQRMKLFRRTTSYLFSFMDTVKIQLGFSETKFDVTDKVASEDTMKRYEEEVVDFGSSCSVMYTIIATLALINLFGVIGGTKKVLEDDALVLQVMLCVLMVMLNKVVYEALFVRSDRGCLPSHVLVKSLVLASFACFLLPYFLC
ncbi:cellulose synthase-like protein E6 [Senna tora]|uniref:Cellulose synthase-like protein E6 n=1 Tax=Senna tora TaxID=362788 RepID=A0A834WCF2_9FABA|nr:cellulose synthase-like protein E6 [Senna tora]